MPLGMNIILTCALAQPSENHFHRQGANTAAAASSWWNALAARAFPAAVRRRPGRMRFTPAREAAPGAALSAVRTAGRIT